jgi:hypothetical protein
MPQSYELYLQVSPAMNVGRKSARFPSRLDDVVQGKAVESSARVRAAQLSPWVAAIPPAIVVTERSENCSHDDLLPGNRTNEWGAKAGIGSGAA